MTLASRRGFVVITLILSLVLGAAVAGCGVAGEMGETRTITSVTEIVEPPLSGSASPLGRLTSEISTTGIMVLQASGGPGMTGTPMPAMIMVYGAKGQDPATFQATADAVFALAEKYKQSLYFETLQVVVATGTGEVLYDHLYQVDPPVSTSSTAQGFLTYYSGPALRVTPREGVSLETKISRGSDGATIQVSVWIGNDSATEFALSLDDFRFFVDGAPLNPIDEVAEVPPPVAAGSTDGRAIYFFVQNFDPYAAGILYVSTDPGSAGFTASDGPVPAISR